jgi:hypothetical protein
VWTLAGFTPIAAAISLLVLPSTTSFRTSRSRGLSRLSGAAFIFFLIAAESGNDSRDR